VLQYLVSVTLVAAATIVLFGVASISLLGSSKETLTGSRIDSNSVEDKSLGTVFFYSGDSAGPVPFQKKPPSSTEANDLLSSAPAPQPAGAQRKETVAEPSPKPLRDGELSAAAVEIPNDSTRGPSTDTPPSPKVGGSHEVTAEPASVADEASAAQHASGATMPPLATSDEQLDQISHNFEIRRNDHGSLDQGSTASTPEGRFLEETQVNESTGSYGSAASPRSHPPLRHAASRRPGVVQADRDNIAKKLNRAELSRLMEGKRALSRAPLR
jgi:hypothetical protein